MQSRKKGAFLIQLGSVAYSKYLASQTYSNPRWRERKEEMAHGLVRPGDTVVVFCLGSVPEAGNQLVAVRTVRSISPDQVQIKLDGKNQLLSPIPLNQLRRWVLEGRLDPTFQYCGNAAVPVSRVAMSSVKWLVDPEEVDTAEEEERVLSIYRNQMGRVRRFLFEQPRPAATIEQQADWIDFCVRFGNHVEAIMIWSIMDKDRFRENAPALYARTERQINAAHAQLDQES